MEVSKGTAQQIATMATRDGLKPEQIAQALGMPIEAVLGNLAVASKLQGVPRRQGEETRDAMGKRRNRALGVLDEVMEMVDDQPHLALAAAKFVLEVDVGKHDGPVSNQAPMNITQINQILVQGNTKYEEICKEFEGVKKPELINV